MPYSKRIVPIVNKSMFQSADGCSRFVQWCIWLSHDIWCHFGHLLCCFFTLEMILRSYITVMGVIIRVLYSECKYKHDQNLVILPWFLEFWSLTSWKIRNFMFQIMVLRMNYRNGMIMSLSCFRPEHLIMFSNQMIECRSRWEAEAYFGGGFVLGSVWSYPVMASASIDM